MRSFKKITAAVISGLISFSAVSALPETTVDSNPNFSYKILEGKDIILTEIKPSKLETLSGPVEGYYNVVEIANDASKAKIVKNNYTILDAIEFWGIVIGLGFTVIVPVCMLSNPNIRPEIGKFKNFKYIYSKITSVDLPHCKKVGKNAFLSCQNLKTVSLPKCTILEKCSLMSCHNVTKLNVPECLVLDNPFGIDTSYPIRYDAGKKLKELNAQKCTRIEDRCFGGFMNLEKLNLPNLISVGCESFAFCRSLKNVSLNSCAEIKECAFRKCTSLKNIDLPNCKKIGWGAFEGCCKLTKFNAPNVKEIGANAFGAFRNDRDQTVWFKRNDLEEVYVPSCSYIGENAFSDCKKLKKITVSHNCKFAKNSLPFERVSSNKLEIIRV